MSVGIGLHSLQVGVWLLLLGPPPHQSPAWPTRLHHRPSPRLRDPQRGDTHTAISPSVPPPSYVPTVRTATWVSASEGERTALQQAVQPNGTNQSLTVTLAVMRHSQGIIGEGRLGDAGR